MDYKIVICSHKRSDLIQKRTLAFLASSNVPLEKITIFVAPEEVQTYQQALPGLTIKEGALGLKENKNKAVASFPEGAPLVFFDDDVKGLFIAEGNKLVPVPDLHNVLLEGFRLSKERGCSLWGFYPCANAKWLKKSVTEGLVFIYGCAYGIWNRRQIVIEESFKEDYEKSIRFYENDGKNLRLNWIAPKQSYLKGKGGLNETRTYEKEVSAAMKLKNKFPTYVILCHKKDRIDIRFPRTLFTTVALVDVGSRTLRRRSDASATSAPGEDDSEKSETV